MKPPVALKILKVVLQVVFYQHVSLNNHLFIVHEEDRILGRDSSIRVLNYEISHSILLLYHRHILSYQES